MADTRGDRNFGAGKSLNNYTCHKLADAYADTANRGSAAAQKAFSALVNLRDCLRSEFGIRDAAKIEQRHLNSWAKNLKGQMTRGELSGSATSSYISAINGVFKAQDVSLELSAKELGVGRGQIFSNRNLTNSRDSQQAFASYVQELGERTGDIRYEALSHSAELQKDEGLRFRESCQIKIDGKKLSGDKLSLAKGDGVKNNQPREFSPLKMDSLRSAQAFVTENNAAFSRGSLIPGDTKYIDYKAWAYNVLRDFRSANPQYSEYHFHGNRHDFAQEKYTQAWITREGAGAAVMAPVICGKFGKDHISYISEKTGLPIGEAKNLDKSIRAKEVAEALGHHRGEITYSYLGR